MKNKNYNFSLAEEMVISVEESLKGIFNERSNQIYYKLNNILNSFNEEKVSTSHFYQSSGSGHVDLCRQKIDDGFA